MKTMLESKTILKGNLAIAEMVHGKKMDEMLCREKFSDEEIVSLWEYGLQRCAKENPNFPGSRIY